MCWLPLPAPAYRPALSPARRCHTSLPLASAGSRPRVQSCRPGGNTHGELGQHARGLPPFLLSKARATLAAQAPPPPRPNHHTGSSCPPPPPPSPVRRHRARQRRQLPHQRLQQRGFALSVWSHQRHPLALLHAQRHRRQHGALAGVTARRALQLRRGDQGGGAVCVRVSVEGPGLERGNFSQAVACLLVSSLQVRP